MTAETMTSDKSWPALGNPQPPITSLSPEDPNPEWEMIAEVENENTLDNNRVVIMSTSNTTGKNKNVVKGRPRSATIGGEAATDAAVVVAAPRSTTSSKSSSNRPRTLRRCASTPDLLMGDSAHEVIVEDESDSEDQSESEEDAEFITADDESFEVLSDKHQEAMDDEDEEEDCEDNEDYTTNNNEEEEEESATLVSTPSIGTSSWTMASTPVTPTSVWGMKKSPSFKDILAKNMDSTTEWGKDKAVTEAKLRDSHRRHHLRVRTKPKFIVVTDANGTTGNSGGPTMMKHAHSTGDLTNMLTAVEGGHESSSFGPRGGRNGRSRAVKKQLSAMMEEEEDGDFGYGGGGGGGGGGDVEGDTDAMDYYHRKDHGVRSTSNKKKERPDEAKRREIIMHKKDMQRKKQAESQQGGGTAAEEGGGKKKKKKNEKGFGGKKERRRT